MQIRSFINSRNEAFYVVGFKDAAERSRMFDAISRGDVFLPSFGERMEFSELVSRLAKRDAGQIGIPGIVAAIPLRDEEMNKLLGGMTEILLEASTQRAALDEQDRALEKMCQDFSFGDGG